MHITLGWDFDRGACPATGDSKDASHGHPVMGPVGFLTVLERAVGQGGRFPGAAERTSQYLRRLTALGHPDPFFTKSFALDAWMTAQTLLHWRDELVAGGWRPDMAEAPDRLQILAAIEKTGTALAPSIDERLIAVGEALQASSWPRPAIKSLRLVDDRSLWPPPWQRMFDRLDAIGIQVDRHAPLAIDNRRPSSNLATLQRYLADGSRGALQDTTADQSLVLLSCANQIVAAEVVADWLAAGTNDDVVMIQAERSVFLDQALMQRHLPMVGGASASPWRGPLQVLPAAIRLLWKPFDVAAALDFLALPASPIGDIAPILAQALATEPGRGGRRWTTALAEAAAKRGVAVDDLQTTLMAWLPNDTALAGGEIDADRISTLAGRVAEWAAAQADTSPVFAVAQRQADQLRRLVDGSGRRRLDRRLVGHMAVGVMGEGVADPGSAAEATPWRTMARPGQLWQPAGTVLWAGFFDDGDRGAISPWSSEERTWMAANNLRPADHRRARRLEQAAMLRAVAMADRRLILVRPEAVDGERPGGHPLWNRILQAFNDPRHAESQLTCRANPGGRHASTAIGGRTITREKLTPPGSKAKDRKWLSDLRPILPNRETVDAAAELLSCPRAYGFDRTGRLRRSMPSRPPTRNQTLAGLIRALIREVFQSDVPPDPTVARNTVLARFDDLAQSIAAPIFAGTSQTFVDGMRKQSGNSIFELASRLSGEKLTGIEIGQAAELTEDGWTVVAAPDVVASNASGERLVLSVQWGDQDYWYRRIRGNEALDLALQAGLMAPLFDYGYFLADSGKFLTAAGTFGGTGGLRSDATAWPGKVLTAYRQTRRRLMDGMVPAQAIKPRPVGEPKIDLRATPCPTCRFSEICDQSSRAR